MRHLSLPLVLIALALLASCGQPVCFMGAGDCEAMFSNAPSSTGSTTGTLTINTNGTTTFRTTDRPTFTATGGNGTYTWSIITPEGCGSFPTSTQGTFTPILAGTCKIQVTDTTTPSANLGTVTLTITQ